jgi:hypothetical protein
MRRVGTSPAERLGASSVVWRDPGRVPSECWRRLSGFVRPPPSHCAEATQRVLDCHLTCYDVLSHVSVPPAESLSLPASRMLGSNTSSSLGLGLDCEIEEILYRWLSDTHAIAVHSAN